MSRTLSKTATPGVYRRDNRYVVVLRDRHGRQFKRFATTLGEARDLKASLQTDLARGELSSATRTRFADYASTWVDSYQGRTSRGIRVNTLNDYRRVIQEYAIPFFGTRYLCEIEPADIRAFAMSIAQRGVSRNTVRLHVAPVRALLASAVDDGLIRSNPASSFRNIYGVDRQNEPRRKALTEQELQTLLDEIPEQHRLLVRLLSETGLRIGEAAALRWSDIDFRARRIHVTRRYYRGTIDEPKSRYGVRTVPLSRSMAATLESERESITDADGLIFTDRAGGFIDGRNLLLNIFKPAARRANVGWANLHSLRHTCASRLFKSGWNAKHVQLMLGHHSPAFTLDVYVHLMPDDLPEPLFG